jgi:hypothetical protein
MLAAMATGPTAELSKNARTALVISVVGTIVLYAIPNGWYLAYPLRLISTAVHELGHGIAAVFMGGEFEEFRMWSDGSGVARSSGVGGGAADAFVSAGGLCGPAVAAAVFLYLGRKPSWARWCLYAFTAFLGLAMALWVRGTFGLVFVGGLAVACFVLSRLPAEIAQIGLVFLATQLALSVYSGGGYLFTQWADTGDGKFPSDVQQMAMALGGPYWLWGLLCAAFSAGVLVAAARLYLRAPRAAPVRPLSRA